MLVWYNAVVVCLSVCQSQAGIVPKRLDLGSRKQRHTIVRGLYLSGARDLMGEISIDGGAKYRWGRLKSAALTNVSLYLRNGRRRNTDVRQADSG